MWVLDKGLLQTGSLLCRPNIRWFRYKVNTVEELLEPANEEPRLLKEKHTVLRKCVTVQNGRGSKIRNIIFKL